MISAEVIRRAKRGDRDARDYVLERAWQFVREDQYCEALSKRVRDEFDDLSQDFVFRLEDRVSSWWENDVRLWLQKWWRQHVFDASRKRSQRTVQTGELGKENGSRPPKARREKITDHRCIEDDLAEECDRPVLEDSLNILSDGQRKILEMRCWKDLKNHEIAEELGISESAVSSRLQRAKNNDELREELKTLLDVHH